MRLIYHPDAEAELIEAAQYYERSVSTLGMQFLDEADRSVSMILVDTGTLEDPRVRRKALPHGAFSIRNLLPDLF